MVGPAGRLICLTALACIAMSGLSSTRTLAKDPAFLPGLDPGGLAIAIVGFGVDYTNPEISKRLARDGEGTPIGWDFIDEDHHPFVAMDDARNGAAAHRLNQAALKGYRGGRLISVRADPGEPQQFARAVLLASRTPARIVAVPVLPTEKGGAIVDAVAEKTPDRLFVVAAQADWETVRPNVVHVAPLSQYDALKGVRVDAWMIAPGESMFGALVAGGTGDSASDLVLAEAVARAAAQAACAQHTGMATSGQDARDKFLAMAKPSKTRPGLQVHDPMCWYGGVVR